MRKAWSLEQNIRASEPQNLRAPVGATSRLRPKGFGVASLVAM